MIQHAQIIAAECGVIEVMEEGPTGRQFSYFRKDGKYLGARFEHIQVAAQVSNTVSPTPR
jgi:hypothetical protein